MDPASLCGAQARGSTAAADENRSAAAVDDLFVNRAAVAAQDAARMHPVSADAFVSAALRLWRCTIASDNGGGIGSRVAT